MIYAISDLHLSISTKKPMHIFGDQWLDHEIKIKNSWINMVDTDDLVLIPGDISWAMKMSEARQDLKFISHLPGDKILLKGNHDYWWDSLSKLTRTYSDLNLNFLQNNSFTFQKIAICGTRGWVCPNESTFTKEDELIYQREVHRLELSLQKADKRAKAIIVMMHYPPLMNNMSSGFVEVFKKYGVKQVIYGHLHGVDSFNEGPIGNIDGIKYQLVSADYLDFKLSLVL